MQPLRADTTATVLVGPLVDRDDGVTPEEGITLAAADSAEIMKHDGTTFVDVAGAGANQCTLTHKEKGMYTLAMPVAILDTEGRFTFFLSDESVCLPYRKDFVVLNANVYDSLYAATATDYLQVDSLQLAGQTVVSDAGRIATTDELYRGTVASAIGNTDFVISGTPITFSNQYLGMYATFYDDGDDGKTNSTVLIDLTETNDFLGTLSPGFTVAAGDVVVISKTMPGQALTGADGDTLKDLSDEIAAIPAEVTITDSVTMVNDNLSTGLTNTLTHKESGTLTDTSAAPTITVTRDDNNVDVAGYPQAMTVVSTGVWNDTFTPPAAGISYTVTITYTMTNGTTRLITSTVPSGTSSVTLNSFITIDEYFKYHDRRTIARLSDDTGAGVIDTDVVTEILNSASAYIYSYIRGHYKNLTTTDFSSITDSYIKKLTAILATAYLYERRGGVLPETVSDDKARADFELDQIQKGKRQLEGGRTQKLVDKVYPLGEPDTEHTITEDFTDGQSGTDRAIKMP